MEADTTGLLKSFYGKLDGALLRLAMTAEFAAWAWRGGDEPNVVSINEEYCISEGWVRVQAGKTMDRRGNPLTIKLSGPVEAWFEDLGEGAPAARA